MKKLAHVVWKSPSNIAFIKYWGKYGEQLPKNPSLSMTLEKCYTETSVSLYKKKTKDEIEFSFLFDGSENEKFSSRIRKYLERVKGEFSYLDQFRLLIESKNSFPHSAGIASSASAMSALALCLASLEKELGHKIDSFFYQKVSEVSRLGSGSASRSVYGEYAVWGKNDTIVGSSDNYAVELGMLVHRDFKCLRDVILIVDSEEKSVSSSVGHSLMNNHPYAEARFKSAKENLLEILACMRTGDFNRFAYILEHEALSLHAMMMTANPWYTLLTPNSLAIIKKIKEFREAHNVKIAFTIDAGPNIHLIYPASEEEKIKLFLNEEILVLCANRMYIVDNIGLGPELLVEEYS